MESGKMEGGEERFKKKREKTVKKGIVTRGLVGREVAFCLAPRLLGFHFGRQDGMVDDMWSVDGVDGGHPRREINRRIRRQCRKWHVL